MTDQTGRSILRNSAHGLMSWLTPLVLGFVATPLIISSLGVADYGIYALILGFIGYSFTFAIGRAITKYVAEYRASGESEKIREIVSATLIINIVVGGAGVVAILLMAEWLVTDVLRIEEGLQEKSVYGLYIAAFVIFFTVLGQAFSAVLQGLHRFDVYSKLYNASSFLLLGGNVVLALLGYGLLTLMVWSLAASVVAAIGYLVSAKHLLPEFGIQANIRRDVWRLVLTYSSGVVGYQLLANAVLLFERGLIIRQLGPEALSYYVVPLMIGIYMHGFVSSLILVVFPLASALENDRPRLKSLYQKAMKGIVAIVAFMVVSLVALRTEFLSLYIGNDFAARASEFLAWHAVSFGAAAILTITWQISEGLGHTGFNFRVFAVCAALCIPIMTLLIEPLGLRGVAIARLIGFGTIFFSIFLVEKKVFGQISGRFWLRMLAILAPAAGLALLVESLIVDKLSVGWHSLLLAVSVGGSCFALTLWVFGFVSETERLFLRSILNRRNA
jgi:O-antigen/teichoic acid export membrane protein